MPRWVLLSALVPAARVPGLRICTNTFHKRAEAVAPEVVLALARPSRVTVKLAWPEVQANGPVGVDVVKLSPKPASPAAKVDTPAAVCVTRTAALSWPVVRSAEAELVTVVPAALFASLSVACRPGFGLLA